MNCMVRDRPEQREIILNLSEALAPVSWRTAECVVVGSAEKGKVDVTEDGHREQGL